MLLSEVFCCYCRRRHARARARRTTPSPFLFFRQVALARIQSLKTEILVQTPGKLGSAHPMPQLMIPPRNQRPSFPLTTSGPPESP